MGKKANDEELDKDNRQRLEKLDAEWSRPPSIFPEKLSAADLRLLLEHFTPLQDLIRAIAALPASTAPGVLAQETTTLREQIDTADRARDASEEELARVRTELSATQNQCRALENDLVQCSAATQKLLTTQRELEQAHQRLEQQLQQAQHELNACRLERTGRAPAELALLRSDTELAQRLDLADLPADDSRALIQMVAVLAQRDNLERLWSALKERCEEHNRPAPEPERALLAAALAWHNHNWRTRPYHLIEALPGTPYDFAQHMRSRHTAAGETVGALRLPGLADGSGKPFCKALVSTH